MVILDSQVNCGFCLFPNLVSVHERVSIFVTSDIQYQIPRVKASFFHELVTDFCRFLSKYFKTFWKYYNVDARCKLCSGNNFKNRHRRRYNVISEKYCQFLRLPKRNAWEISVSTKLTNPKFVLTHSLITVSYFQIWRQTYLRIKSGKIGPSSREQYSCRLVR